MEIEDDTANALREHVLLERELEDAKINLAIKPDFNLFDAFNVYDFNRNGYISQREFKKDLDELGIYASMDEIELFFKRYDKNRDNTLKFSEFCEAMLPKDIYYSS
jgi:Ca2+-binding EF-hand superfamily protein